MFQTLRQQRAASPQPPPQETPRIIPSIQLTTATPVAPPSLAPKGDSNIGGTATSNPGSRRVVPKRTLVLHQAPPPLPLPPPRSILPVKDHDGAQDGGVRPPSRTASRFGSSSTTTSISKPKIKVLVDPPATTTLSSTHGTYNSAQQEQPLLVKKKKSRAALDSIKWALGDRTNGTKDTTSAKSIGASRESSDTPRPSIDSEKDRWKWTTLGRGRKDSKEKGGKFSASGSSSGSQPSSVRLATISPPLTVNTNVGSGTVSGSSFLSPASATSGSHLSPFSPVTPPPGPASEATPNSNSQFRSGSLAVRAMRSVRSMARIGGWGRDSPTSASSTQQTLLSRSTKASKGKASGMLTAQGIAGSGESWLAGAPSSIGSPNRDLNTINSQLHIARPRASTDKRVSLEDEDHKPLPTIKFASPQRNEAAKTKSDKNKAKNKRGSALSALSISSSSGAESLMPRDSISTDGGSSNRSSFTSSRRSSGATTNSFSLVVPPIAEDGVDAINPTMTRRDTRGSRRDRDSKAVEGGRKRGSLANVFDLSRSSSTTTNSVSHNSLDAGSSEGRGRNSGSPESPGGPVPSANVSIGAGSTFAMVVPDPFSPSNKSDSFFPAIGTDGYDEPGNTSIDDIGIYVPGETPARRPRPRPMSEQLLRPRPTAIVADFSNPSDGFVPLNMVSAATEELSNLINRLDLSATPDPSPAKRWSPHSPRYSPDPMPEFAMHTLEQARRVQEQRRGQYPDVPTSVNSKADRTLEDLDSSFSSAASVGTVTMAMRTVLSRDFFNGHSAGSISDLRASASKSNSNVTTIHQEPSITSLRPYQTAALRRKGSTIRASSVPSTMVMSSALGSSTNSAVTRSSVASIDSPLKHRTIRRRFADEHEQAPQQQPREQSSVESLNSQLHREIRRNLGFSGTLGEPEESPDSETSSNEEPRSLGSSEYGDSGDSDIPEDLQAALSSQSEDNTSIRSPEDMFSIYAQPTSPLSAAFSLPTTTTDVPTAVVTPPSIVLYDSNNEEGYLDESPSDDDAGFRDDDTGKKSFDFTGELNKLNQGGSRLSFVEQLEVAFKTPDAFLRDGASPSGAEKEESPVALKWELPSQREGGRKVSLGHLSPDVQFASQNLIPAPSNGRPERTHSRTDSSTSHLSEKEISLLSDLDASMYALATLNLSLVHPSSQSTLTARPLEQAKLQPPLAISNVSFAHDCDSSAYNIANIDLSLIHPSRDRKNRPSTESNASSTHHLSRIPQSVESSRSVRLSLESDTESKRETRESLAHSVVQNGHSREHSEMSLSSLGSIINSGVSDPFGYKRGDVSGPPPIPLPVAPSPGHAHSDSLASIPSISSLGRIINPGTRNPFGYAPSTREHSRNVSEVSEFSLSAYMESSGAGDGKPGEGRQKNRKSTGSDRSTFYFRSKPPPMPLPFPPALRNHQRNESTLSNSSIAPPVSLDHSSFRRHHRNRLSNDSGSSIAHAYGVYGANGGRALWAKHQSEPSVDSVNSDFSGARLGRPGLGDKMLESAAIYRGAPLTSIMASPSVSEAGSAEHGHARHSSFDSARDPSDSDSLFEAPHKASSVSSDSLFGADEPKPTSEALLFGKNAGNRRIRPLSVFSVASATSSTKDDDTMISLLGGGHVSCKAVGDSFASSPCFKPKRKRPFQVKLDAHASEDEVAGSPTKLRLVEKKRVVVSQLSSKFGRERMDKATKGLLKRQSLEEHSLTAEGSDVLGSTSLKEASSAYPRPLSAAIQRNIFAQSVTSNDTTSRPATVIFTSPDTPPATDCSESGSQSSIDVTRLSVVDALRPLSTTSTRIRARGHGHRRRSVSRSSMVETIAEEVPGLYSSPYSSGSSISSIVSTVPSTHFEFSHTHEPQVHIADWEEDAGGEVMRRYYALRKEALDIVQQSKQEWADTDFSRFAVSSFKPPQDPVAIQAFYDYSVRTYTPLPLELCIRRPRTSSRPSPYGNRTPKKYAPPRMPRPHARSESMEQAFTCISPPALAVIPPTSPFVIDRSFSSFVASSTAPAVPALPVKQPSPVKKDLETFKRAPRQRVASKVRRSALGWSKQRNDPDIKIAPVAPVLSATANGKENGDGEGLGLMMSPTASLRLSRPRPKARPQSMLASVRA